MEDTKIAGNVSVYGTPLRNQVLMRLLGTESRLPVAIP